VANLRDQGWAYFDAIVAAAPLRDANPWRASRRNPADPPTYEPDYDTLELLLGVPVHLGATSQSGVPALALDVWVAYEFRRAGFDPDRVWPRAEPPRVLPAEVTLFVERLPRRERAALWAYIGRGHGGTGTANLLGKNYVKQVDVVMSSWATGPELMVSTKRMDSSFGKNAANRVEESYGDAKNLRLRHPQAALGFVYALSALALSTEAEAAEWLIDLLIKLGREDDAYDAVALLLPDRAASPGGPDGQDGQATAGGLAAPDGLAVQDGQAEQAGLDGRDGPSARVDVAPGDAADEPPDEPAGPIEAGATAEWGWDAGQPLLPLQLPDDLFGGADGAPGTPSLDDAQPPVDLARLPRVRLLRDRVPAELDPGRFFAAMCARVLDNSPVNFHRQARERRKTPRPAP
jgi:hypothetical protein